MKEILYYIVLVLFIIVFGTGSFLFVYYRILFLNNYYRNVSNYNKENPDKKISKFIPPDYFYFSKKNINLKQKSKDEIEDYQSKSFNIFMITFVLGIILVNLLIYLAPD